MITNRRFHYLGTNKLIIFGPSEAVTFDGMEILRPVTLSNVKATVYSLPSQEVAMAEQNMDIQEGNDTATLSVAGLMPGDYAVFGGGFVNDIQYQAETTVFTVM